MNTIGEQDIFIRLPLAVRIRVYRYLLIGAHTLVTNSWKRVHETYPRDTELRDQSDNSHIEDYKWPTSLDNTILRTSRQTHAEASAILFRESAFQVTYHISDLNRGLEDLDIGDLEANLHRILHLTINIVEADDEPEDQPALQLEGSHSQLEEIADKETKKTEKKTRGIALLFERYAARCTALRRLTVCFEFEEARRRPRDPQSRWRPMLELVLRNEAILRALASLAVRDQVVIKTNVKTEPFYTKEINGFVSLIAGLKGWESKSESSGGLDTEEGPIDKTESVKTL
ncbi:MAG: hypothetical protein HETSPECPRED_010013 [Heterodermia speciosa]|uniref:Uncharacterized protein n=1 Tax=Heterodermia speciosa TaxID=116794 RepID=A0A8H3G3N1_9LECA|nr:MAG: hypothetical protein HETSPECPRED_010013 [Heterodermia speciosa]